MTDLERTYNALAERIEDLLRHPHFEDAEIGRQLIDLHVEILSVICPPEEHHNVMGGAWSMGAVSASLTMRAAFELIASHRAAWAERQAATESAFIC